MSFMSETSMVKALESRPVLQILVEDQLKLYKEKYHKTLRMTAGFMAAYGYAYRGASFDLDADELEDAIWDIVDGLQKAGIIPKSMPVVTLSWYVLRWVIIPFIRAILANYSA